MNNRYIIKRVSDGKIEYRLKGGERYTKNINRAKIFEAGAAKVQANSEMSDICRRNLKAQLYLIPVSLILKEEEAMLL